MVNPWRKYKGATKRKKEALHSLIAGFLLFSVFYAVTRFFPITLCPMQNIFGVDCFGCGLTRGFIAVLSFDLKGAVHYHVLSIPLFIGILVYALLCCTDILFDRNDLERLEAFLGRKYMFAVYVVVLAFSVYINKII